jgi:hypothetical protein
VIWRSGDRSFLLDHRRDDVADAAGQRPDLANIRLVGRNRGDRFVHDQHDFARARHQAPFTHHVPAARNRDGDNGQPRLHRRIETAAFERTEVPRLTACAFREHDQRQAA